MLGVQGERGTRVCMHVRAVIPVPTLSTYSGMEASSKLKLHTETKDCEDDDVTGKVGGPVSVVRTKAWGSRCLAR